MASRAIPPFTAFLEVAMILAYWKSSQFSELLHLLQSYQLLHSSTVWQHLCLPLLSSLQHSGPIHLVVDLIGTLFLASKIEQQVGTTWNFLYTFLSLFGLSRALYLILNLPLYILASNQLFFFNPFSFLDQNLVTFMDQFVLGHLHQDNATMGLSELLFALNFLCLSKYDDHESMEDHDQYQLRVLIESLALLSTFHVFELLPQGYFLKNVAGILAGFLYVNIPPLSSGVVLWTLLLYNELFNILNNILTYSWDDEDHDCELDHGIDGMNPSKSISINVDHDLDALWWLCCFCNNQNGILWAHCESCKQPRPI